MSCSCCRWFSLTWQTAGIGRVCRHCVVTASCCRSLSWQTGGITLAHLCVWLGWFCFGNTVATIFTETDELQLLQVVKSHLADCRHWSRVQALCGERQLLQEVKSLLADWWHYTCPFACVAWLVLLWQPRCNHAVRVRVRVAVQRARAVAGGQVSLGRLGALSSSPCTHYPLVVAWAQAAVETACVLALVLLRL
ncbi:hypothetical protein COO60DRAFT_1683557 [Scenedesmus sp. NREL 46B-D3]|nr:hypothetical protein COO60DRAFT_1683557 [Scenedesmus sp. NREL 46B-D3]